MTYKSMATLKRCMRYSGQKLKRTRKVRHFFINPSTFKVIESMQKKREKKNDKTLLGSEVYIRRFDQVSFNFHVERIIFIHISKLQFKSTRNLKEV